MSTQKIKIKIGRPIQFDGVQYGVGEYELPPRIVKGLQAKNASLSVFEHIRSAKDEEREREEREAALLEGAEEDAAGQNQQQRMAAMVRASANASRPADQPNALQTGATSEVVTDETGGGGEGEQDELAQRIAAARAGEKITDADMQKLSGELPKDFPRREELAAHTQPVTTFEQLVNMTGDQLMQVKGIKEKGVEEIGLRLYELAQQQKGNQQPQQ